MTSDYEMFVDLNLLPNEVGFVMIKKTVLPHSFNPDDLKIDFSKSTLEIVGFSEKNEALFKYVNPV